MRLLLLLVCLATVPSCAHFSPPSPALLGELREHFPAQAIGVRRQVVLDIESPGLSGVFEGVLIATRENEASVRLQLFPGIGGKVLDLGASPRAITFVPHEGDVFHTELPSEVRIEPSLGFLFAATLMEHFSTFDPGRLAGVRPWKDGWELKFEPGPSGVQVHWFVTPEFDIAAREYHYGMVSWRGTGDEELRVEAWRTEAVLETTDEESDAELGDDLFTVPVPPRGESTP